MCQPARAVCVTKTTLWYVWAILFICGLDMHDQPLQRFSDHSDKCWYLRAYSVDYSWAGSSISRRWSRNSGADWSQLLQCVTTVYGSIRNVGHNYTYGVHCAFLILKNGLFPLFKCWCFICAAVVIGHTGSRLSMTFSLLLKKTTTLYNNLVLGFCSLYIYI